MFKKIILEFYILLRFMVASLLVNVKCNFFGCTNALFKYGRSTISYGCLGETNTVGCTPFTTFKDVSTLSPNMQEVATTIMEVDSEVASKQCSQTINVATVALGL
jgi:hypothetical protein